LPDVGGASRGWAIERAVRQTRRDGDGAVTVIPEESGRADPLVPEARNEGGVS
jgi:hypothetical protein